MDATGQLAMALFDDTMDGEDEDIDAPYKYDITPYGADFDVSGLVRRLRNDDVVIPTFQRSFIWTVREASRFIESLLYGLPVPGIFLSKEEDTRKLLVIDGQQRLRSLQYFYEGAFPEQAEAFALTGLSSVYQGLTYAALSEEDRRMLDDAIIHATIIRQDSPPGDNSSIYLVFERINTGGRQLMPQQIRSVISRGEFKDLLTELNGDLHWRAIYGDASPLLRDEELILRFFALQLGGKYEKPMKSFLNGFMKANQHLQVHDATKLRGLFKPVVERIHEALGDTPFRPRRGNNAALFEAVMLAVAQTVTQARAADPQRTLRAYRELLKSEEFMSTIATGTTDEEVVEKRTTLAKTALCGD